MRYKFPFIAALLTIISGVLILIGWTFDIVLLKSLLPFWSPMKANAALCFVLLGSAIILSEYLPSALSTNMARFCLYSGQACAMLAGLISLLSLAEYAFHVNFGIDEYLFRDSIDNAIATVNPQTLKLDTVFPGRIKLEAAVCILLLAIACIHSDKNHWRMLSASLGLVVLALALASLSTYFTPDLGQFGWFGYGVMRMNAAVLYALLSAAVVAISWQRQVLSWMLNKNTSIAFILGLLLLVMIGFNSSRAQFWLQSIHEEIALHEKIATELDGLLVFISKAQTDTRGYVITGDEKFLKLLQSEKADSFRKLNALQQYEFVIHQNHYTTLVTQLDALFQWYQQVIDSRNIKGLAGTKEMIFQGTERLENLSEFISQLQNELDPRITELKQTSERVTFYFYTLISIVTLLSVITLLIAVFRYNILECRERDQAAKHLEQKERHLRTILNESSECVKLVARDGTLLSMNPSWLAAIEADSEEAVRNHSVYSFIAPEYRTAYQAFNEAICDGNSDTMEFEIIGLKGTRNWMETRAVPFNLENGDCVQLAFTQEITKRKHTEERLRILSVAVEQSPTSIVITDLEANLLYVNPKFTKVTGYSFAEAMGQNPRLLQSGLTTVETYEQLWNNLTHEKVWQGEFINRRKNGEAYWEEVHIAPVKNLSGVTTHYVEVKLDITERKAAEEEIKQLAFYDPLTGLPNRRKLLDRLQYAITLNHRANSQFAVFMLDLDRFKAVNDKLGHAAGDELLKQVAVRITHCLRDSDMVARLGGDEFVLVLENLKIPEASEIVALKVIADLTIPFQLSNNNTVQIGASIGISIYPQHGNTPEALMDNADTALYQAKECGRGCFAYFSVVLISNV